VSKYDYDLFVIGGGSGGVRAGRIAATHGAKVAVAEEFRYGGTCVIRGCVPKKLLTYAAHYAEDIEDAAGYGWSIGEHSFSWPKLIANKDKEIDRLEAIYRRLLNNAGVTVLDGRATVNGPNEVVIGGKHISVATILVATGAAPVRPDVPGIEHAITSNEAFHLAELPQHVLVVGGGYIAVEFAGIFHGLGAKTTLIYRGEQILRGFDDDVRNHLAEEIRKKGLDLRVREDLAKIEPGKATLKSGATLAVDAVMIATGRKPNTKDLGLEAAGVRLSADGAVQVDEWSRSSVPSIYAVGDVTNRVNLTPVAIVEGHAFADTVFGGRPRKVDHSNIASAVFSSPTVGVVGMTETQARQSYAKVDIYRTTFTPMRHTLTGRGEKTLMKLVVDGVSDRVLGAHMVGPDAAEIVQCLGIAVKMGATKVQFDATIAVHPTASEEFVTMRTKVPESQAKAAE
jgi:glutathione reductase (NADPH)